MASPDARAARLRVHPIDFAPVVAGSKLEVRLPGELPHAADVPCPVKIHARDDSVEYGPALAVLLEWWHEPLGAISAQSIANEGFESLDEFRNYWRARHPDRGFRPLSQVTVFKVRPWQGEADREHFALAIFDRMYGDAL